MKKGQFSIEAVFAYFLIAIAIIAALAIIFYSKVLIQPKVTEAISGEELDKRNLASLQLAGYLRTQLPDDLPQRIRNLKGTNMAVQIKNKELDEAALYFEQHPEIYQGRTYGEFISNLYHADKDTGWNYFVSFEYSATTFDLGSYITLGKEKRQNMFAAVTRATFGKKMTDKDYSYLYPNITVSYGDKSYGRRPYAELYVPVNGGEARVGMHPRKW